MSKTAKRFAKSFVPMMVLVIVFCLMPMPVAAAPVGINDVDISVELNRDGSARITEKWDVDISEGTEFYITKEELHSSQEISDLQVTDQTGREYEILSNWDVNDSRKQKDGRAGINIVSSGYEICIGFGSYGRHTLTFSYTLTNLVISYIGADAINQAFLPAEVSSDVPHAKLTISYAEQEMVEDNTLLWVFRFPGEYGLKNGKAVFDSDRALVSGENLVALLRFEQGMFSPMTSINKDFEDVLAEAKKGSEYVSTGGTGESEGSWFGGGLAFFSSMLFWIPIALIIIVAVSSGKKNMREELRVPRNEEMQYCRNLPFGGNLELANAGLFWAKKIPEDNGVIGALILRWMQAGFVVPTVASTGVIWKKDETALTLGVPQVVLPPNEQQLYSLMLQAAGPDRVLQSKEFERWANRNYTIVSNWADQYYKAGLEQLRGMGAFTQEERKSFGIFKYKKDVTTQLGYQMIVDALGFKKYLVDFTIINERQAQEVHLWQDYLVFAQLFGIADTVLEQFKHLYPAYFAAPTQDGYVGGNMYHFMMATYISRSFSQSAQRGVSSAQAAAAAGGGGSSSGGFGGGGGSFGGGGSMGSR